MDKAVITVMARGSGSALKDGRSADRVSGRRRVMNVMAWAQGRRIERARQAVQYRAAGRASSRSVAMGSPQLPHKP